MPQVLTTNAEIKCGHGGILDIAVTGKLTVNGNAVLTQALVTGRTMKPVPPCVPPPPPPTFNPCATCDSVTAAQATKLSMGGKPVLLQGPSFGTTNGTIPPVPSLLTVTESQTILKSI